MLPGGCLHRAGLFSVLIFVLDSPELQPTEVTKVENIFCCSSVFGQPDLPAGRYRYVADNSKDLEHLFVAPAEEKECCTLSIFECVSFCKKST